MIIQGLALTEIVDSSGEILLVDGCDISTLDKSGTLNYEHCNEQADSIVGKIIYAKKIFTAADCENDDQLRFYKQVNVPCVYIIGELFDAEGHPGSLAIAAMFNYAKKNNQPMMIGFSIEGSTMERDGMYLKRTVARRCAVTVKPANKSCTADILEQIPEAKKAMGDQDYRPLSRGVETLYSEFEATPVFSLDSAISDLFEFQTIAKSLTAGSPSGAPGSNTQGAALQGRAKKLGKEEKKSVLSQVKAYVRDNWKKDEPLEIFIKNQLPALGDKFKEHFSELMDELHLAKSARVAASHRHVLATVPHDGIQKLLVAGIRTNRPDSKPVKTVNSLGDRVMVSRGYNTPEDMTTSSEKAVAYHNIARDFFGLGGIVPTAAVYINPMDGRVHHAVRHVDSSHGLPSSSEQYDVAIRDAARSGLLIKAALMDYVLGHPNRNLKNLLMSDAGWPSLVSNEKAFSNDPNHPEYLHLVDEPNLTVDEEFMRWLLTMQPDALYRMIRQNGLRKPHAEAAVRRLVQAQQRLSDSKNIESLYQE